SLNALASGGRLAAEDITHDLAGLELSAVSAPTARRLLIDAINVWSPLRNHLSTLLVSPTTLPDANNLTSSTASRVPESSAGGLSTGRSITLTGPINAPMSQLPRQDLAALNLSHDDLEQAVIYVREHNLELLELLQVLTVAIDAYHLRNVRWLHTFQVLAVGLFIAGFAFVLRRTTQQLAAAHGNLRQLQQQLMEKDSALASQAELSKAEHALRESELRTRLLLDAIPDGVCRIDRDGIILEVKRPELFQYVVPFKEVLGRSLEDVLPAADAKQARRHLQRLFTSHEPQHYEASFEVDGMLEHRDVRWVFIDNSECLVLVRDITEQIYTQQALEHSEEQALAVLEAIPDAIGRFSRDGYYLEIVNQGSFAPALPRLRLEGRHIKSFLPEASAARMQHYTELMYETGEVQQVRYHIDADDGNRYYRDALLSPLTDNEHVGLIRDVTNQVLMERALEASEGRFREITETIDAVFFVFNVSRTRFSYVSPKYEQVFGYSRDDLYKNPKAFIDCAHEDDKTLLEDAYKQFSRGEPGLLEYRIITSQGELRWLSTHTFVTSRATPEQASSAATAEALSDSYDYPIYTYDLDTHKQPDQRLIGSITDISERKRAEQALLANEARLRTMMTALPDGIAWLSRDGRYLEVLHSDNYTPLVDKTELIGKTFEDVLPEDIARRFREYTERVFDSAELQTFEYTVMIDDLLCYRDVRLVPFDDESCILIVRDISERKQADLQLQQALEEQTVLLKEIHHRVKNNLQVIASLLMLQSRSLPNEAAKLALEESRKRVVAMATVHKTMYEKGSLAQVDFRQYLTTIVPNMTRPPQAAQVEVVLDLASVKLHIDQAIPCGLIVSELLDNVFEHAFPTTTVQQAAHTGRSYAQFFNAPDTLDEQHVTVCLTQVDNYVKLVVTDNGVGLPTQLDTSAVSNITSLGMSIVATLAGQIDGELNINRLEPGTEISLRFPLLRKADLTSA
ncbi:MAG: PAS domain-containing protein, partial [Deinococcota bacterium]